MCIGAWHCLLRDQVCRAEKVKTPHIDHKGQYLVCGSRVLVHFPACHVDMRCRHDTYMVKNDYSSLNHIIRHYWSSFSCGECLKFVASNGQQMKRHIPKCGKPKRESKKKCSKVNKAPKAQSSPTSGHKSKKAKKDKVDKEGGSAAGQKKPHGSPSKSSGTVATSQEQDPNTPHHSACNANSTSGHPKKSKKHEKLKKSPNRMRAHMYQGVWCTRMLWGAKHVPRHLSKWLPINLLFLTVDIICVCYLFYNKVSSWILISSSHLCISAPHNRHVSICFVSMCIMFQV